MTYLPVETSLFYLIVPIGFILALGSALIKPAIGLGKTVAKRLADPNRDIFGRRKGKDEPDPIQEGLRTTTTVATRNMQSGWNTTLSNIGLGPAPAKPANIALIAVAILAVILITKK